VGGCVGGDWTAECQDVVLPVLHNNIEHHCPAHPIVVHENVMCALDQHSVALPARECQCQRVNSSSLIVVYKRFTFSSIIERSESFTAKTTVSLPPAHHHDTNATGTTAAIARG
jgi:hypothetical protein